MIHFFIFMLCHSVCWWLLCNILFPVVPNVVSFEVVHDLLVFVMSLDAMRRHSYQCCANHPVPLCSWSSISVSCRSSCPLVLCVIHLCCVSCVVSFNTVMHDLFAFVMSFGRALRHPCKYCANHHVPWCYAWTISVVWYLQFIFVPNFLLKLLMTLEIVTIASLQEWWRATFVCGCCECNDGFFAGVMTSTLNVWLWWFWQ